MMEEQVLLLHLLKKKKLLESIQLLLLLKRRQLITTKRKHRFWVHEIIKRRHEQGAYDNLVRELELDRDRYHDYFRMSAEQMDYMLGFVGPIIIKATVARETISAKQRLAICIRFLATGETYKSLESQYRVGLTTVSKIVPEVCSAIWETMHPVHLSMPQTTADWMEISDNFMEKLQYPHCIGCIDGKHVVMRAPAHSGSSFYNYKGTFSVVLLALMDAEQKFIYVDIGSYGKQSDAGVFSGSKIGQAMSHPSSLHIPEDAPITGAAELGPMPYVIPGDEAFPLQKHIMRPYPGRDCTEDQQVYNYRHSRARRIVECAFGKQASRWRVNYMKVGVLPGTVNVIIQATTVLHNMLQVSSATNSVENEENSMEAAQGLVGLRAFGTVVRWRLLESETRLNTFLLLTQCRGKGDMYAEDWTINGQEPTCARNPRQNPHDQTFLDQCLIPHPLQHPVLI